jgi:hypothetical protein
MTRMGKVLLTVLVLMLTCFLLIGAGSFEVKAQGKKNTKLIKIWVDKDTGQIVEVKLGKETPPDQDATVVPGNPDYQWRGTILFYQKSNPGNCIVIVSGGYPMQVCW